MLSNALFKGNVIRPMTMILVIIHLIKFKKSLQNTLELGLYKKQCTFTGSGRSHLRSKWLQSILQKQIQFQRLYAMS